ncbi:MAG TPA: BON domain-containing protein [Azospirillaceae bacterium]|nr:BON domain-containing protein [Azospirillaceae bacterium]
MAEYYDRTGPGHSGFERDDLDRVEEYRKRQYFGPGYYGAGYYGTGYNAGGGRPAQRDAESYGGGHVGRRRRGGGALPVQQTPRQAAPRQALGGFVAPDDGAPVDFRGRGPRGYVRSDERIREDVADRLTADPYVDASDIDVTVSQGEVTLSGQVDRREARRRAEDIAEAVSGVRHVRNDLRVRGR